MVWATYSRHQRAKQQSGNKGTRWKHAGEKLLMTLWRFVNGILRRHRKLPQTVIKQCPEQTWQAFAKVCITTKLQRDRKGLSHQWHCRLWNTIPEKRSQCACNDETRIMPERNEATRPQADKNHMTLKGSQVPRDTSCSGDSTWRCGGPPEHCTVIHSFVKNRIKLIKVAPVNTTQDLQKATKKKLALVHNASRERTVR